MYRSVSLRAVVCLSTLFPMALQAAPDSDVEALKRELLELKQRYDVQQKALAVLEQRVRQVEDQPAAPQPKRLAKSPSTSRATPRLPVPGPQRPPEVLAAVPAMGSRSRMIRLPPRA